MGEKEAVVRGRLGNSEDAIKAYKAVVRYGWDISSYSRCSLSKTYNGCAFTLGEYQFKCEMSD